MAAKKKTNPKKTKSKQAANKRTKTSNSTSREPIRGASRTSETADYSLELPAARGGGQSGDLQGLSNVEGADSESVVELLEEGNAFEAGIVTGVESAGNREEREIHTQEVLEDDVPSEYLGRD